MVRATGKTRIFTQDLCDDVQPDSHCRAAALPRANHEGEAAASAAFHTTVKATADLIHTVSDTQPRAAATSVQKKKYVSSIQNNPLSFEEDDSEDSSSSSSLDLLGSSPHSSAASGTASAVQFNGLCPVVMDSFDYFRPGLKMNLNVRRVHRSSQKPQICTLADLLYHDAASPAMEVDPDTPCHSLSSFPASVATGVEKRVFGESEAGTTLLDSFENSQSNDTTNEPAAPLLTASGQLLPHSSLRFTADSVTTPHTYMTLPNVESTGTFRTSQNCSPSDSMTATFPSFSTFALPPNTASKSKSSSPTMAHEQQVESLTTMEDVPMHTIENAFSTITENFTNHTFQYYTSEQSKTSFFELFQRIIAGVKEVLQRETIDPEIGLFPRVSAPAYVLGDIHGNYEDLTFFLQQIILDGNFQQTPANILCLGDYVDRGEFSLECVMLLFALKMTNPAKIFLLRGNHEDRAVCGDLRMYGTQAFLSQCHRVFGYMRGTKLFKEVTELFRYLPLAAELVIEPCSPLTAGTSANSTFPPPDQPSVDGSFLSPSQKLSEGTARRSPFCRLIDSKCSSHFVSSEDDLHRCNLHPEEQPLMTQGFCDDDTSNGDHSAGNCEEGTVGSVILCTHGGIPRFKDSPLHVDALGKLRSLYFPRLLTLFPHHPTLRDHPDSSPQYFHTTLLPELLNAMPYEASLIDEEVRAAIFHATKQGGGVNLPDEFMQTCWLATFDLLWSDPMDVEEPVDGEDVRRYAIDEWGFGLNERGEHVISFSAKAVDTLLRSYGYAMLFRAHQEKSHGLRWSKSRRVLTIFSSSNYMAHRNGAGCVVVSPTGELQLIEKMSDQT